jgi:predicted DsbA family dithiol-disulfide isomerase
MKVEIWSDVMCPFCYIGKRRFEKALDQIPGKEAIEVEWKSFLLNPGLKTDLNTSTAAYLSKTKGMPEAQITSMMGNIKEMGKEDGLVFDFDKTVVNNTENAHRLIQMAKAHGRGDEAEEVLFEAYFSQGRNVDDVDVLVELGEKVGLESSDVKKMLGSDRFKDKVKQEYFEGQQLGVKGVPFFVLDRKFGVSGAQPTEVFVQALQKALEPEQVQPGNSCDTDSEVC